MKDLYIAHLERLMADEGLSYEEASERAYDEMREDLADRIDYLRKRRRENGETT